MRAALHLVAAALVLLVTAVIAALGLSLADAPAVARPAAASIGDVAAALGQRGMRDLFGDAGGGGGSAAPSRRATLLSQREVEVLVDRAVQRWRPDAAVRVELRPGAAVVRGSVPMPGNPFGQWLNFEATLRDGDGGVSGSNVGNDTVLRPPAVESLRVGRLPLPAWVGDAALRRLGGHLEARLAHDADAGAALRLARDMVRGVHFEGGGLRVDWQWRGDASLLADAGQQARARAYHDRLAALAAAMGKRPAASLAELLPPMFALARERSAAGGDAAQENRAALLTLALHATGRGWPQLAPAVAASWTAPRPVAVTLRGRDDFAQHWLISAALAIEGGGALADAAGVYKELDDTRHGSGFSFNDIAADRAGARFGLLAVQRPALVQARLAAGVGEADLIPDTADLPEFMSAAEFARRYGGVGSPAFERMRAAIEARVAALAVLQ